MRCAASTTAAGIWVTAAVGAASEAGLPVLAGLTAGIYLVTVLAFPVLTRRLPRSVTALGGGCGIFGGLAG